MSGLLVLEDVQARVWEDFQRGAPAAAPPPLLDCWSRARGLGAPTEGAPPDEALLRGEALRMHVEQVDLLRALGDAVLERAAARVSARDYLLLVADADGVVVETTGGGGFADTARALRLIPGACWSEAARGTNAIGTAVSLNQPTVVRGHAHFGRSYHGLVCYAAPVRGFDGTPLAVLDATSAAAADAPEVGEVVRLAAHALEELLRMHAFASAGASVTRVLGRALDRMREPVLLVEAPGRVARANGSARAELGAALVGADPRQLLGMTWAELAREALAPEPGGLPCQLGPGARAWRLRAEPITGAGGAVLAVLVHLETVSPASHRAPAPATTLPPSPRLFAEDAATLRAVDWARRLAASEVPVMLLAETGAGKELVASMIHEHSPRAERAFVAVNCGAIAPTLLESELFGYAGGAFTGADRAGRPGLLHAADGGTLFLDEVAEMSPAMQASLLRVLESGTYRRVGDTRTLRADVRVVCATCRELPALVASGAFRQDLYFRLKGASVRLPSLRERSDVVALARHVLRSLAGDVPRLSTEAEEELSRRSWPGNVRELKSVLEVAVIAAAGAETIEPEHLGIDDEAPSAAPVSLSDSEAGTVQRALAACGGNVSTAAKRLGVARSTLYRMMRRHGLA